MRREVSSVLAVLIKKERLSAILRTELLTVLSHRAFLTYGLEAQDALQNSEHVRSLFTLRTDDHYENKVYQTASIE
jgi:hypothetical protein